MNMAKVGVVFDKKEAERRRARGVNVFAAYIGEVLNHAGIPFEWLDGTERLTEARLDVAIVAFAPELPATTKHVWEYASRGGTTIAYGRLHNMASKLGCVRAAPFETGYASLPAEWGDMGELRFAGLSVEDRSGFRTISVSAAGYN
ncbi:hypothetical protein FE783_31495 [Paenibacillus mesophilus]|uniref:hypothetical protein n=1 Tax=Paenibacillus mesophilus TaxID=2582849 RepID=UPI00110DA32C|nr:hypothetical protein [Paenibacillus mesophilus]TMV44685.1 hypothetical protein FE783_31495 [Paenibacillus mesophilus]